MKMASILLVRYHLQAVSGDWMATFGYYGHFYAVIIMSEKSLPNYLALCQALDQTALKLNPSQAHGLVCGLLCGNPKSTAAWEELVTGGKETQHTHEILQALYDVSAKQMEEVLFDFQLLLPPDTDELPVRAEALTLWCQGALTGLKLAQVQLVGREPSEMTEAINDLIEIAKMNFEEVVSSEEDESAYAELVEYVRVAVVLVYQDLRAAETAKQSTSASGHLH